MQKKDCFYLGKIAKKFSYKGELLLFLDTDNPEEYLEMESVFVEQNNHLVPFFIEQASLHKNFLRVRFEDVTNEAEADQLVGSEMYLPLEFLPELADDKFYYHEITGFNVIDQRLGHIGIIESINDTSSQALFVIRNNDTEILIPMVDDFIVKIDKPNQTIILNTPNGLVDLYLS